MQNGSLIGAWEIVADLIKRLGEVTNNLDELIRSTAEPEPEAFGYLAFVEEALRDLWNLGRNLILAWSEIDSGIAVLVVPHYVIALPRDSNSALAISV